MAEQLAKIQNQNPTKEGIANLLAHIEARRPPSPSARDPSISRHYNVADLIEERMNRDGHRTWGFVIYRTTYVNDRHWAQFLAKLNATTKQCFDVFNGLDVLARKTTVILDDEAQFNKMTSHKVREHFQQWTQDNYVQDQFVEDQVHDLIMGHSPRYRFAIQIDEESLASIINEPTTNGGIPPLEKRGWVKFIHKNWVPSAENDTGDAKPLEALEGITSNDVGWMRQHWKDIHSLLYQAAYDLNYWSRSYRRPPQVVSRY